MPRRNHRESYQPLDLTSLPIPRLKPQPLTAEERRTGRIKADRSEAEREAQRAERQRQARMNQGIDWSICLVPGCGNELRSWLDGNVVPERRDTSVWVPICGPHAAVIHRNVEQWRVFDPYTNREIAGAIEREEAQTQRLIRKDVERAQGGSGVIYFVRQNGLVKVGWSSDIEKRLRAYGPNVEILCHYPGSRQDETTLHRQLRAHLAKGREWYHDGDAVALFVSNALKRYGPPKIEPTWTEPKVPEIRKRQGRR